MTVALPGASSLAPPPKFGNYERGSELGHGAFGRVFECSRIGSKEILAVKIVDLRGLRLNPGAGSELKRLKREVDILTRLPPHPNIVQLVETIQDAAWFFLVLELVRGGDLFGVLMDRPGPKPRLSEREASFVFWQLVKGLVFLHEQAVVHRDLKLENVLISSEEKQGLSMLYRVKISDFGLSKVVSGGLSRPHSSVGTQKYVAPEVLGGADYDFRVDLWSLGVLLYILLEGSYPHERPTHATQEALDKIVMRVVGSDVARSIITGLLQHEPTRRLSLEALHKFTWSGSEEVPLPPIRRVVSHDTMQSSPSRQGGSLFGSESFPLPPPAPGASFVSSASFSFDDHLQNPNPQEAEPDGEQGKKLYPSAGSVLALFDEPSGQLAADASEAVESQDQAAASEEAPSGGVATVDAEGQEDQSAPLTSDRSLSNVRAASVGQDELQLHIVVPDRWAGAVLGKAGAHMKHVKASTGCNAWITPRNNGSERYIVIVGSYAACFDAQSLFIEPLSEAMQRGGQELKNIQVVLFLRNELVGAVVGKQGQRLMQLHTESGAQIKVLRDEVEGKRPCVVFGTLESVLMAEVLIADIVRNAPPMTGMRRTRSRSRDNSSIGQRLDTGLKLGKRSDTASTLGRRSHTGVGLGKRSDTGLSGVGLSSGGASGSTTKLSSGGMSASTMMPPPNYGGGASGFSMMPPPNHGSNAKSLSGGASGSTMMPPPPKRQRQHIEAAANGQAVTKLLVPGQQAGAVIGKQGFGLRRIQSSYGVQVEVLLTAEAPEWPRDRVVILGGGVAARQAATDAVLRCVFPASPGTSCTLKMLVSSTQLCPIKEEALKVVSHLCNVKVSIEPEEFAGERLVLAEGHLAQVSAAATAIIGTLEQV